MHTHTHTYKIIAIKPRLAELGGVNNASCSCITSFVEQCKIFPFISSHSRHAPSSILYLSNRLTSMVHKEMLWCPTNSSTIAVWHELCDGLVLPLMSVNPVNHKNGYFFSQEDYLRYHSFVQDSNTLSSSDGPFNFHDF